jgi:hypothetical protein
MGASIGGNGEGARYPLHQGLVHIPLRSDDASVASWTGIQPCREGNRCPLAIPSSPTGELLDLVAPAGNT